jgi:hypothetical protein
MLLAILANWEISMRLVLVSLALCIATACSAGKPAEEAPADKVMNVADAKAETPATEKTIEDMRAESLAAVDQDACAKAGGEVRQEGMLGMYRCVKPYADAGKTCRSKSDCEGKCLAVDDALPDQQTTGVCQADDGPFGCYAEVEDGKISNAICVD